VNQYYVYAIAEARSSKKDPSRQFDIVTAVSCDLAAIERGEEIVWFFDAHTARHMFGQSTGIYNVEVVATSRGTAPTRATFLGGIAYTDVAGLKAVS
jgi:hypothetical protein